MLRLLAKSYAFRFTSKRLINLNKIKMQMIKNEKPMPPLPEQHSKSGVQVSYGAGFEDLITKAINEPIQTKESAFEQMINSSIKMEIKAENIYKMHNKYRTKLSSKNVLLMLTKVLLIRKSDVKEAEDIVQFQVFLQEFEKKMYIFSPEELIKLIATIKQYNVRFEDLALMKPVLELVIKEFNTGLEHDQNNPNHKNKSKSKKHQNKILKTEDQQFEYIGNLYTISVKDAFKLLFGLYYIKKKVGNGLSTSEDPLRNLDTLLQHITMHLYHHLSLTSHFSKNDFIRLSQSPINTTYLLSLLHITNECPLKPPASEQLMIAIHTFLKRSNFLQTKFLFQLEKEVVQMDIYYQGLFKANQHKSLSINTSKKLFHHIQKRLNIESMLQIEPKQLIWHLKTFLALTQKQVSDLKLYECRCETIFDILTFSLHILKCYFTDTYNNHDQKHYIRKYIQNDYFQSAMLSQLLLLMDRAKKSGVTFNASPLQKLIDVCCEFFNRIEFSVQCSLVILSISNKWRNSKELIESFFQGETPFSKYHLEVQLHTYSLLLEYLPVIREKAHFSLNTPRHAMYLSVLLKKMHDISANIPRYAYIFSVYLDNDATNLSNFLKMFVKESMYNRVFGKRAFPNLQPLNKSLKKQNTNVNVYAGSKNQKYIIADTAEGNKMKFDSYRILKTKVRERIERCLCMFEFIILILENMAELAHHHLPVDITKHALFKELFLNFEEELKILGYRELFTQAIYLRIAKIIDYLQVKGYNISQSYLKKLGETKDAHQCKKIREEKKQEELQKLNEAFKIDLDKIAQRGEVVSLNNADNIGYCIAKTPQQKYINSAYLTLAKLTHPSIRVTYFSKQDVLQYILR